VSIDTSAPRWWQGPPPPPHRSRCQAADVALRRHLPTPPKLPPHNPCARVPPSQHAQPSAEPVGGSQLVPPPPPTRGAAAIIPCFKALRNRPEKIVYGSSGCLSDQVQSVVRTCVQQITMYIVLCTKQPHPRPSRRRVPYDYRTPLECRGANDSNEVRYSNRGSHT